MHHYEQRERDLQLGLRLVQLLGLKCERESAEGPLYNTAWGLKNARGLAACLRAIEQDLDHKLQGGVK